ncbi:peptidoglycan DD-metalloendopeptidase family protein [Nocardioides sp.]|uniref:peptidoglycan DD-metalloendopeptidase family protein n=1 Tax=Nocardioides sp. TaxID=35761 RepID=UPI00286E5657|nr:peptidoglycan DD-metalloendopeptidase family protein [Nocardioides sp.]
MAAATAAAAIALGTLSVPTASADDLKDRQKQVEKKIDRAHDLVDESSRELREASQRLSAARSQLSDARTALATARGRLAVAQERDAAAAALLAQAEATLAEAQAEVVAGQADVAAQRDVVGDTIKQLYVQGDPDLMAFASLMESESAQDLNRRAEVNEAMVDKQSRDYDRLQAAEVLLEVHENQVADARDDVAVKRQEAAANLAETQQLEVEAQGAKASVETLVGERASARSEAAKIRARDVHKLQQAEREKASIEERLRKIAARALARARARAAANGRVGPTSGLLQMPVGGGITSPFGYRIHPIYGYWGLHDGTDFGGGCGQAIVAAEDGRVISSYWSDVYGNRLIIDHGALAGAGIATIYNHAASYTVGTGTQVKRGEVIGYVGDTGWSTACHLHFTVMANGRAVDPANYF